MYSRNGGLKTYFNEQRFSRLNDVNLTGQIVQLDSLRAAYPRFFKRSGNKLSQLTPFKLGRFRAYYFRNRPPLLISTFGEQVKAIDAEPAYETGATPRPKKMTQGGRYSQ
jgi:hypothetical protein